MLSAMPGPSFKNESHTLEEGFRREFQASATFSLLVGAFRWRIGYVAC